MSSTEQTALTIVGAAIGFVGSGFNPAGAYYGASIGFALGASYDEVSLPHQEGPRLSDLKAQTANYGFNLPRSFGTVGHAGTVIWQTDIKEKKKKTRSSQGGKGGPSQKQTSTTYSYSVNFAIAFHDGEIKGVRRIWANEHLIYDDGGINDYGVLTDSETVSWMITKSIGTGRDGGTITVYPGTETQDADPTIQSYEGVDNTPAYRGTAYIVFSNLQLERFGNRIPQVRIEYVAVDGDPSIGSSLVRTIDYSDLDWGDSTPAYWTGLAPTIERDGTTHQFVGNWDNNYLDDKVRYYKIAPNGTKVLMNRFTVAYNNPLPAVVSEIPICISVDNLNHVAYAYEPTGALHEPGSLFSYELPTIGFDISLNESSLGLIQVGDLVSGKMLLVENDVSTTYNIRLLRYTKRVDVSIFGNISTGITFRTTDVVLDSFARVGICADEDYFFVVYSNNTIKKYDWDGDEVDNWSFTPTQPVTANTSHISIDRDNPDLVWIAADGYLHSMEEGTYSYWGAIGASNSAHEPFWVYGGMHFQGVRTNKDIEFRTIGDIEKTPETLDVIVSRLCTDSGLESSDIDVTALAGIDVGGFTVSKVSSAVNNLALLMTAYDFTAYEDDHKIIFRVKGGSVDHTINANDLGAGINAPSRDILPIAKVDETRLPNKIAVTYLDFQTEYDVNTQSMQRSTNESLDKTTIEMPLVLTANEARQIAEKKLFARWTGRNKYGPVRLPKSYISVVPSDVVEISQDSITHRVRVKTVNLGEFVEIEGEAENAADYTSTVDGESPTRPYIGNSAQGQTELYLIDCPALNDDTADDGYYLMAHGYLSGWRGCEVFQEASDGGWTSIASIFNPTTVGLLQEDFASGEHLVIDNTTTLDVKLRSGTLSSITETNMLASKENNAALVGGHGRWEIIQFKTATDNGSGEYTLSGFIRGQQGTEWAMGQAVQGDYFILLEEENIARASAGDLGVRYRYRGVTFGESLDDANDSYFTNQGVGSKPLSPVLPSYSYNGDGTFDMQWMRRARIAAGWVDYRDVPLDEAAEVYRVNVVRNGAQISTTDFGDSSVPASGFYEATVTARYDDVIQIAQVSGVYGPGEYLSVTLTDPDGFDNVFNPNDAGGGITLSNANRTVNTSIAGNGVRANSGVSSGKYYWEITINTIGGGFRVGAGTSSANLNGYVGNDYNGYGYHSDGETSYGAITSSYGDTFTTGDVIGVALDMDNGRIFFSKNGVWQNSGDPVAGTNPAYSSISGTYYPMVSPGSTATATGKMSGVFAYTPPTGFTGF